MNIQFCRLSHIKIADIIALNTNDRVLKQMPLADGTQFDEQQCIAWVKGKEKQWQEHG
ncbi:MAG: N-acetyltransferase, partial [Pseudomonadota bacterium]|nr:N-acetyltransferase [Pseudomonadota bacterium]